MSSVVGVSERRVSVYDPALCCSSGACGPSVDPALSAAAADLAWLESAGVQVERFNLAQQPQAFAGNERVLEVMRSAGESALPIVLLDGELLVQGRYPSRAELAVAAGVASAELPLSAVPAQGGCAPGSGCC
jgi:hypothetical protein